MAFRALLSGLVRRRAASLVVLTALIALTASLLLAGVAGARRASSSVTRFEHAAHEYDALITAGGDTEVDPLRPLLRGPLIKRYREITFVLANPLADNAPELFVFAPLDDSSSDIARGLLVEGRRVDPTNPTEVVLFENTAKQLGVGLDGTLDLGTFTPAQAQAMLEQGVEPQSFDGPAISLHVVGIARNPPISPPLTTPTSRCCLPPSCPATAPRSGPTPTTSPSGWKTARTASRRCGRR